MQKQISYGKDYCKKPNEKAYEQTVIELLKRSPHWKPARLSDGEEVNMEFTLPVVFTPEVRKK
jgi:hypothetical protein